jgi:hypothetical protein
LTASTPLQVGFRRRQLALHGPCAWLLRELAELQGVGANHSSIRYIRHVLAVATLPADCVAAWVEAARLTLLRACVVAALAKHGVGGAAMEGAYREAHGALEGFERVVARWPEVGGSPARGEHEHGGQRQGVRGPGHGVRGPGGDAAPPPPSPAAATTS